MKKEDLRKEIINSYIQKWSTGKNEFAGFYVYWSINSDGSIDVDGNVKIVNFNEPKLPFKFGTVTGDFSIGSVEQPFVYSPVMTDFVNFPNSVNGRVYTIEDYKKEYEDFTGISL